MKRVGFAVLLLGSVLIRLASAEVVTVDEGKITFEAPAGFATLSPEVIAAKWPTNQRPKSAVGNAAATTTIAYDLKPHEIPADKLPEVKAEFTKLFSRIIPGIVWKRNEIRELAGRQWIYFEITSSGVDTDIYNMMLLTGHEGQMLVFNFNSTKEEFPRYETALRKSLASIAFAAKGAEKEEGGRGPGK